MTTEQIAILERDLFPYVGGMQLSCTGEPLYLKNLGEGLAAVQRAGVPFVRIQTNGTHLDERRGRLLLAGGLDVLGISLDASRKETFEEIRAGGEWEPVIENVRNFVRTRNEFSGKKTEIALNFAMMKQNESEAVEFVRLAKELGADSATFTHLFIERAEMREWSLVYDTEAANRLHAEIRAEAARLGLPVSVPPDFTEPIDRFDGERIEDPVYYGPCVAARESWIFLLANGDCFPCQNLGDTPPIGNLFETPFPEIWASRENQRFRQEALAGRVEGCDHCKFFAGSEDQNCEMTYLAKRLTTTPVGSTRTAVPA